MIDSNQNLTLILVGSWPSVPKLSTGIAYRYGDEREDVNVYGFLPFNHSRNFFLMETFIVPVEIERHVNLNTGTVHIVKDTVKYRYRRLLMYLFISVRTSYHINFFFPFPRS
jgi:hypothetical protein